VAHLGGVGNTVPLPIARR